ncbi:hypothetical protein N7603_07455 [Acholeplasma vituli]|uniref:Beta-galactosidase n=1 Tax=Paracholeplasma vituli TaxID=69473 RepID=A0ABT2PX40_9MOLU|nr:glycoside hydrolase family 2 TIM barrel-domain containing protein [Paracholeplasma vituli]MCU0105492.1 hypothetical protein [Paracholeplasma vituli]
MNIKIFPPFGGVVDYLGYVGIYREVSLIELDPIHIQDVFVYNQEEMLKIQIELSQVSDIELELVNPKNEIVWTQKEQSSSKFQIEKTLDYILWWDIEHPNLYRLMVKTKTDTLSIKFGFRTIEFKDDGFYLNHRKIALRGLNRHQSFPYVGYAMPKSIQRLDADILKYELSLNIVRSSHYPPSKHFIERCDEIGLLLFEELPGWQHIGGEAFIQNGLKAIEEMILRDRNHPSIILWGVRINESGDHKSFYEASNKLAHQLDPSRPTGGVRNFSNSEFFEDVYTYNDFSHTGLNPGVTSKHKVTKAKPYLVTEHNGHMFPTKKFDPESKRVEHALRHLNVLQGAVNPKALMAGAIGWCMSDYNTHKEFGSGDKICYHGVLDMDRLFKTAGYAYQSQGSHKPVMHIASTMQNGEYAGGYLDKVVIFTNMDYIKLYRNDTYIDTYYPNVNMYPHLPHPPVFITDFIGQTLKEKEHMREKDAEATKRILRKIQKDGNHLPLRDQLRMLFLLKKYKMKLSDGVRLFYEYTSGWGSKETIYTFVGYQNDQIVLTDTITSTKTPIYRLKGNDTLMIEETYDVLKLVFEKTDTEGHVLAYAMDGFTVSVSGDIELISPEIDHLHGGSKAIYIRSKQKGEGTLTLTHPDITLVKTIKILKNKLSVYKILPKKDNAL